jgi:hypothetical protein
MFVPTLIQHKMKCVSQCQLWASRDSVTMKCTRSKIGSPTRCLLTLLTALVLLMGSTGIDAQNSTRSFQMALWGDPNRDADSDIAVFVGLSGQSPVGRTIWAIALPDSLYNAADIDRSRIVAAEIDEPYSSLMASLAPPAARV